MTDLETAQFSAVAPIAGSGVPALSAALADASRDLELNAQRAGYRMVYGTAELTTETRTLSDQTLTSTIAHLTHHRTLTMHATGVRADQLAEGAAT